MWNVHRRGVSRAQGKKNLVGSRMAGMQYVGDPGECWGSRHHLAGSWDSKRKAVAGLLRDTGARPRLGDKPHGPAWEDEGRQTGRKECTVYVLFELVVTETVPEFWLKSALLPGVALASSTLFFPLNRAVSRANIWRTHGGVAEIIKLTRFC